MAGYSTVKAIVLRDVQYKESDRILTLFTDTDGKITVKGRGAARKSSRIGAASQLLTYSELTLFENRGKLTVDEGDVIESFDSLRSDFENYALGCYFAECAETFTQEGVPDEEILQLILNSLYALSRNLYMPELIKAVFEMRLMSILGYRPDLEGCIVCGVQNPTEPLFGIDTGHVCCRKCRNTDMGRTELLCEASLNALRYAVDAPAKKIFSIEIDKDALHRMNRASEAFVLNCAERNFSTLDYWRKIRI